VGNKKISYWWAVPIGLVFPALQALIYFLRFGGWNPYAGWLDYVLFFTAAALGGLVLIAFLRASRAPAARWIVLGAYLLATPFALMGMLAGGLLGPLGVILFSLVIWAVFTAIGYFVGRLAVRGENPAV
jgi:hypothetical protein